MQVNAHPTLSVCARCKEKDDGPSEIDRAGYRLTTLIHSKFLDSEAAKLGVTLRGIRCMSQCKRPCVIALSGLSKYTLLFGDLVASVHANDILHLAAQYANSSDGLIHRLDRPKPLRKGYLGRVPPNKADNELVDPKFTLVLDP